MVEVGNTLRIENVLKTRRITENPSVAPVIECVFDVMGRIKKKIKSLVFDYRMRNAWENRFRPAQPFI